MSKTANAARGEVPLPKAFGGRILIRFSVDAMERLETEYGGDWVTVIIERTDKSSIPVFRTILENTLVDGQDLDLTKLAGSLSETRAAILDALFLAIHGRTVEEQLAKDEEDRVKAIGKGLERIGQDPQMAPAIAFLQSFGAQDIGQGSAPMKSEDSHPEK
jgi:hypothetical protein